MISAMLSVILSVGMALSGPLPSPIPNFLIPVHIYECSFSDKDAELLAKMVWGEARGLGDTEKAACVWCVLNRVDIGYGSIEQVLMAPNQFLGYNQSNPVDEEILSLCKNVLFWWELENKTGVEIGRVLPSDYLWFTGNGRENVFRNKYKGGNVWDWSLKSPYTS